MDSITMSTSNTTIADLNDDCFLEVFEHLELSDLCAAADVSRRFRLNAQSHFTSPKYSKDVLHILFVNEHEHLFLKPQLAGPVDNTRKIYTKGSQLKLLTISKVLRNFGAFIKYISFLGMPWEKCETTLKNNGIKENKVIQLISLHCSGTLMSLGLSRCDITAETENTLRPVLLHLRSLTLHECKFSNFFARMLSLRTPGLRALHFACRANKSDRYSIIEFQMEDILRQTFLNLLSITLRLLPNVNNIDIEEFLKRNPQLKKIGLLNCRNVDGGIFQSIATHAPEIEAIQIDRVSTIDDRNLGHIGKLKSLHTLKLCTYSTPSLCNVNPVDHLFMPLILHEIHASNIPLQNLHIAGCGIEFLFKGTDQLIDAILKIKTLQELWFIRFKTLKMSHIHDICKQLKGLSKLYLCNTHVFISPDNLLAMIKYAPRLQSLQYLEGPFTFWRKPDEYPGFSDEYMKMVEIVGQRQEGTRLLIELTSFNPILKNLPKDLSRKFKHILTLAVADDNWRYGSKKFLSEDIDM